MRNLKYLRFNSKICTYEFFISEMRNQQNIEKSTLMTTMNTRKLNWWVILIFYSTDCSTEEENRIDFRYSSVRVPSYATNTCAEGTNMSHVRFLFHYLNS